MASRFARATFFADNRADLAKVTTPALIVQCSFDAIAPLSVGRYVHQHIKDSQLLVMRATGHCPNLSAPEETIAQSTRSCEASAGDARQRSGRGLHLSLPLGRHGSAPGPS